MQAKIGVYSRGMFGFRDGPVFAGAPTASTGAAHMAVSGILAALIARETTGRGQRVDTSLVQGMIPADYFGIYHVQLAGACGRRRRRRRSQHCARRRDGGQPLLALPLHEGRPLDQLLSPAAAPGARLSCARSASRARSRKSASRTRRSSPPPSTRRSGRTCSGSAFRAETWAELQPQFIAQNDLPFELCGTSEEALDHPQIIANGEVVEVDDPVVGKVRAVGPLATFAQSPSVITRSAPALGAGAAEAFTRDANAASNGAAAPGTRCRA